MATVNKDFKIKNGLVVEGTTATVNGFDILTKKTDDQNYIIGLIGGTATSNNTPNAVVKRDGAGSFSANVITASVFNGEVYGNASTATALQNSRMISLTGDVSGAVFFDGSANAQITTTIDASFATDQEVTDAVAQGVLDAAADATNKADTAYSNAVSMANTLALYAQGNAYAYTDGAITNLDLSNTYDALGAADTAYNNAIAYAEGYTDNAVAALVDGAPQLLDTLNELAEALQDNPNVISTIQDVAAGKQDALTTGDGINIIGNTISASIFGGGGLNITAGGKIQVDRSTVDGWYDANGAAANALADAESYADSAAANALADANSYTDNAIANIDLVFNTDEISEGATNQYFTDSRAKISAADLLTGATLDNITITGDENGLTITAENGVADSTTDDLDEGSTNLYFTDARAVDALEAVVPNFTAVEINSIAKQIATTVEAPVSGVQVLHTFLPFQYRAAEYLVKVSHASDNEISKILLTVDSANNVAVTEYGIVSTNGSLASSVSADFSGGNVRLLATTLNNDSVIKTVGTLLS